MDNVSLIYVSIYSLAWLFGIQESYEEKESKIFIFFSIISGMLLITGVALSWPKELSIYIKESWKAVFILMIIIEVLSLKYEIEILKRRIPEETGQEVGYKTILITILLALIFLIPGFYYSFKVAFL